MNTKYKITLFIILAIMETALFLFMLSSTILFFMEGNKELFQMTAAVSTLPFLFLAISIGEIIRIKRNKLSVFINSILMKFTVILFTLTLMYATVFFEEIRIASVFFGILTLAMFAVTFFCCKRATHKNKQPHYASEKRTEFTAYKAKWAWDDAAKEYMQIHHLDYADLSEEDNQQIYEYASMPAVYLLAWLVRYKHMSDAFYAENQTEEVLNGTQSPLSFFVNNMDYTLVREDIHPSVLHFIDSYFDSESRRHYNLYTMSYICDYYQAIQNKNHFYYCVDYTEDLCNTLVNRIEQRFGSFNSMYETDDYHTTTQTIHWLMADKDLSVSTIGNVSRAYIQSCENALNNLPEKEKERLFRMLKENYSYGDHTYHNLQDFISDSSLDEILIYEPKENEPAFVILTESGIEEEHGLSIGFRNGHVLYINYRMDYENPWDEEMKDVYSLSLYNTDICNIHDMKDTEKLIAEDKLIIYELNDKTVYITRAALQMIHKTNTCIEALEAYGYSFESDWKIQYHDNNPVPYCLYFKAHNADGLTFSQTILVWQ